MRFSKSWLFDKILCCESELWLDLAAVSWQGQKERDAYWWGFCKKKKQTKRDTERRHWAVLGRWRRPGRRPPRRWCAAAETGAAGDRRCSAAPAGPPPFAGRPRPARVASGIPFFLKNRKKNTNPIISNGWHRYQNQIAPGTFQSLLKIRNYQKDIQRDGGYNKNKKEKKLQMVLWNMDEPFLNLFLHFMRLFQLI